MSSNNLGAWTQWFLAHPKIAIATSILTGGSFFLIRQWGRLNSVQQDIQAIKERLERSDRECRYRQEEIIRQIENLRQVLITHLAHQEGETQGGKPNG